MSEEKAPDPDLDLLQAAGARSQERLGELFARHRQRLLRMVELRMDRALKQRVGASDVLQEAWLDVSARLGDYLQNPRMPFFLWIRYITAQRLLKLHRYHVRTKKRSLARQVSADGPLLPSASSVALVDQLAASGVSPSGVAVAGELRLQLQEALDSMKPLDREVLVLRHFEELTNAEAAAEIGIAEDAASKRYIRALERLRSLIAVAPPGPGEPPR